VKRTKGEKKEIQITIVKGNNLAAKDSNGLSDPYVIVKLGEESFKTKTIMKTLSPVWQETAVFTVSADIDELVPVKFICMDWDKTSKDDYMGEFQVFLRDLLESEDQVPHLLASTTGEYVTGTITISCKQVAKPV